MGRFAVVTGLRGQPRVAPRPSAVARAGCRCHRGGVRRSEAGRNPLSVQYSTSILCAVSVRELHRVLATPKMSLCTPSRIRARHVTYLRRRPDDQSQVHWRKSKSVRGGLVARGACAQCAQPQDRGCACSDTALRPLIFSFFLSFLGIYILWTRALCHVDTCGL
jgi:hypothetical protein